MKPMSKEQTLTTEEIYYRHVKEARAAERRQMEIKARSRPRPRPRPRPLKPVPSNPPKPIHRIEQKPFRLLSMDRHEEDKVKFTRTVVETFSGAEASRVIRERETRISRMPITRRPAPSRQPQQAKITMAHSPKFASAVRARHWKEVVDPKKQEKMELVRRMREHKRAQEMEARDRVIKWTRESIVYKTAPAQDFTKPFKADVDLAPPRLGKLGTKAKLVGGITGSYCNPQRSSESFAASLRH